MIPQNKLTFWMKGVERAGPGPLVACQVDLQESKVPLGDIGCCRPLIGSASLARACAAACGGTVLPSLALPLFGRGGEQNDRHGGPGVRELPGKAGRSLDARVQACHPGIWLPPAGCSRGAAFIGGGDGMISACRAGASPGRR